MTTTGLEVIEAVRELTNLGDAIVDQVIRQLREPMWTGANPAALEAADEALRGIWAVLAETDELDVSDLTDFMDQVYVYLASAGE